MIKHSKFKLALTCLFVSQIINASTNVQSILKLKVKKEGIYRVSYDEIASLGLTALLGMDNASFSITKNGLPVPIKVVSDDNTTFGTNAYIEFVGIPESSLYQEGSVYNLELFQANAKRVTQSLIQPVLNQTVVPYYVHTDYYDKNPDSNSGNTIPPYLYSYGTPIDDPWFAKMLATPTGLTDVISFDIDHVVNQGNVNFEVNVWGGLDFPQSETDHHLTYALNGQILDVFAFDGLNSEIRSYQIDAQNFSSGTQNFELTIANPNDTGTYYDIINVESWKISYPREHSLINSQLNFSTEIPVQAKLADTIFSNGFEDSLKHFKIKNANSEQYRVYQVNQNGSVEFLNYAQSGNCSTSATEDCNINISTNDISANIYVSAENTVMSAELSLPTILEDITQGVYDYLIISHPDFIGTELDSFIAQKQAQSLTVKVVDVEQIYARYGYNNVSAESIAAYLKDVATSMSVKYVLLVGGDTSDYKHYGDSGSISFIPTLYAKTDSLITFAPVDAKFVDFDFDNIPNISIGRFPVRSVAELTNLIDKLTAYNNKSYANTSMFIADRFDVPNNYNFKQDAETFVSQLPLSWQNNIDLSKKVYLDDDGSVAVSKSKIIDNINQGVALTSFIGHSSPTSWSKARMFQASDASALLNADKPTIITQWGCWNTYFVEPNENTLAHSFMLNQNGGAATVLGASTLTKAAHESELAQLVFQYLTHDGMTLGEAVTLAKQTYAQINPKAVDVILGWTILGDPSIRL